LGSYYRLTKPGIIYGNILTTVAGFLLASHWHIAYYRFIGVILGTALVIAAACVINNVLDRHIDAKMARTAQRELVAGVISPYRAVIFGVIVGLLGLLILLVLTNAVTVDIGVAAFIVYVAAYGIGKRRSVHGTLIGSIAGAAPVMAGYCAAEGHINAAAILVFLILAVWQMPHFYAIALYRYNDYKAAGLPVLPVSRSIRETKLQIVIYIGFFIVVCSLLTFFGYTGYSYLAVMSGLGLIWLYKGLHGFRAPDAAVWARSMFLFSLVVIMGLSVMLAVGPSLP
jgi:protoheme IX farnesyltransferase